MRGAGYVEREKSFDAVTMTTILFTCSDNWNTGQSISRTTPWVSLPPSRHLSLSLYLSVCQYSTQSSVSLLSSRPQTKAFEKECPEASVLGKWLLGKALGFVGSTWNCLSHIATIYSLGISSINIWLWNVFRLFPKEQNHNFVEKWYFWKKCPWVNWTFSWSFAN